LLLLLEFLVDEGRQFGDDPLTQDEVESLAAALAVDGDLAPLPQVLVEQHFHLLEVLLPLLLLHQVKRAVNYEQELLLGFIEELVLSQVTDDAMLFLHEFLLFIYFLLI
jgi:hypothetical protein